MHLPERQADGLGLPGPHGEALVPAGLLPAGGVPGPPAGRLVRPVLPHGSGAGQLVGRRHRQAVGAAGLQLPQGEDP